MGTLGGGKAISFAVRKSLAPSRYGGKGEGAFWEERGRLDRTEVVIGERDLCVVLRVFESDSLREKGSSLKEGGEFLSKSGEKRFIPQKE